MAKKVKVDSKSEIVNISDLMQYLFCKEHLKYEFKKHICSGDMA